MKKIYQKHRTQVRNALIFVLGVVITIVITKLSDKVVPNDPVLVKQYADTIQIVHDYKLPNTLDDSLTLELERRLKNLELLSNYDAQINDRLKSIESKITPNLILTHRVENRSRKGYMQARSASYFSSSCPS